MDNNINDGGYGLTGNMSMNTLLKMLPLSVREEYEKHLEKKDKKKYVEFKEWQKQLNG